MLKTELLVYRGRCDVLGAPVLVCCDPLVDGIVLAVEPAALEERALLLAGSWWL